MEQKKLNWGILGTGWIAHEMGEALNAVNGEIYAVCDTTLEGAKKYAEEFHVTKAYGSADEISIKFVFVGVKMFQQSERF